MSQHPPHPPQQYQQQPRRQESANALDAIIPTNPLAAVSCYLGIVSIILCFLGILLGPTAIALGVMGLKKWKASETAYGKTTSTIRAYIGIVTGSIGTLVGVLSLVFFIIGMMER